MLSLTEVIRLLLIGVCFPLKANVPVGPEVGAIYKELYKVLYYIPYIIRYKEHLLHLLAIKVIHTRMKLLKVTGHRLGSKPVMLLPHIQTGIVGLRHKAGWQRMLLAQTEHIGGTELQLAFSIAAASCLKDGI